MRTENRILALREGYYASVEERQRYCAEKFTVCTDPETGFALIAVDGATSASYWGPGTYSALRAVVEICLNDDVCTQIGIEFNSPGGDVNGLFECCQYLSAAKEQKPIHAHVTGLCCSAAYALAASCTDISATDTSEIGSVGVYAQAYDETEALKKAGILSRIFRSRHAENKNASPFSEEGAKDIQDKIDFYEDCFYTVLSEGRNMDREKCLEDFGHGSVFMASDALERRMIDSIAGYGDWIKALTSSDEEEDEGDDMDITTMTAEEKSSLFQALVQDSPSLLAEAEDKVRTAERERISALNAQRNEANAELIDKAVSEGMTVDAIAMDLLKAEREWNAEHPVVAEPDLIETQAENEQVIKDLQNPSPLEMGAEVDRIVKRVADARRKEEQK